jgi:hypothetical protein
VKRISAAIALTALAAATVVGAQQTPQTQAAPPAETQPQQQAPNQTTPPSDQGTSSDASKADKQTLMEDCLTQVQGNNPQESKEDIRKFCEKAVNKSPPQG